MAKGNDGNYLQHSIEVEIAHLLVAISSSGGLHASLTHGMAPFESCDEAAETRGTSCLTQL